MRHLRILVALCLLALPFSVRGQDGPEPSPLRIGLGLIGTSYKGDLTTTQSSFQRFNPGACFSLQFASPKLVTPQLMAGFGKFTAQDRDIAAVDGVQPNTFVSTSFFFVDFRLKARFLREKPVKPYFSLGLGLLGFTPRNQSGTPLIDDFATRNDNELYNSIGFAAPLSLGIEFELSPILHLGTEYTYKAAFTDYLDNIGQLGPADGNDKLHVLSLILFLTFDPEYPIGGFRGKGQ